MNMLKILEDKKAQIEKDMQMLNGKINQLHQALQNGQARALQLQGAYENINTLMEEVKKYAPEDTGGPDRAVEAPEVRDNQDVPANV